MEKYTETDKVVVDVVSSVNCDGHESDGVSSIKVDLTIMDNFSPYMTTVFKSPSVSGSDRLVSSKRAWVKVKSIIRVRGGGRRSTCSWFFFKTT